MGALQNPDSTQREARRASRRLRAQPRARALQASIWKAETCPADLLPPRPGVAAHLATRTRTRRATAFTPFDQMALFKPWSTRTSEVPICFSANFLIATMARGALRLKPLRKSKNQHGQPAAPPLQPHRGPSDVAAGRAERRAPLFPRAPSPTVPPHTEPRSPSQERTNVV